MEIITGDIFYNICQKIKNNSFPLAHIASDGIQNPNPPVPDATALLRAGPSLVLAMAAHCSQPDYWRFQPGCLKDVGSCGSPPWLSPVCSIEGQFSQWPWLYCTFLTPFINSSQPQAAIPPRVPDLRERCSYTLGARVFLCSSWLCL